MTTCYFRTRWFSFTMRVCNLWVEKKIKMGDSGYRTLCGGGWGIEMTTATPPRPYPYFPQRALVPGLIIIAKLWAPGRAEACAAPRRSTVLYYTVEDKIMYVLHPVGSDAKLRN